MEHVKVLYGTILQIVWETKENAPSEFLLRDLGLSSNPASAAKSTWLLTASRKKKLMFNLSHEGQGRGQGH